MPIRICPRMGARWPSTANCSGPPHLAGRRRRQQSANAVRWPRSRRRAWNSGLVTKWQVHRLCHEAAGATDDNESEVYVMEFGRLRHQAPYRRARGRSHPHWSGWQAPLQFRLRDARPKGRLIPPMDRYLQHGRGRFDIRRHTDRRQSAPIRCPPGGTSVAHRKTLAVAGLSGRSSRSTAIPKR